MSLAFRAGIPLSEFWAMTAHQVIAAFTVVHEDSYRLAWRTAYFSRVGHRHFPKTEEAIFRRRPVSKRQTLDQQYRMAQLISKVMH
jgi:hypothetical protein